MGILKNNQKTAIRYECGEIILYEIDEIQKEELRIIIIENTKIDMESGMASIELSYNIIRYIFKFYTTIGEEVDELDDEELEQLIENGNHKIMGLMRAIKEMLREINEEIIDETLDSIRNLNDHLNLARIERERNNLEKNFNKTNEEIQGNLTFEEAMNIAEEIELGKKIV